MWKRKNTASFPIVSSPDPPEKQTNLPGKNIPLALIQVHAEYEHTFIEACK